jgi:hypothetical protein
LNQKAVVTKIDTQRIEWFHFVLLVRFKITFTKWLNPKISEYVVKRFSAEPAF